MRSIGIPVALAVLSCASSAWASGTPSASPLSDPFCLDTVEEVFFRAINCTPTSSFSWECDCESRKTEVERDYVMVFTPDGVTFQCDTVSETTSIVSERCVRTRPDIGPGTTPGRTCDPIWPY